MRKTLNRKLSGSFRIARIFRTKSKTKCEGDANQSHKTLSSDSMSENSKKDKDLDVLQSQIRNLKATVNSLKQDTENKEIVLANIARDKEKLTMDLLKIKRSNTNLAQQLEDERTFYYKEKESYCQEMSSFKKLKKVLSSTSLGTKTENCTEVEKLKKKLDQTLQTNYNLSIKFLKMKESKERLNNTFRKAEHDYKRTIDDLRMKIEILETELNDILEQKFQQPMSPSNKKYLLLVNQNSSLVYENLCLQLQVDQLNIRMHKNKIERTKSDIDTDRTTRPKKNRSKKSISKSVPDAHEIIKIYERDSQPGIPTVTILNEKELSRKKCKSEDKFRLPETSDSKLTVFQVSEVQSMNSIDGDSLAEKKRSRSAPKIVQSALFKKSKNNKK